MGGYSVTSDLDLGKKVGNLDFWVGGVFCKFRFGLREKSWKFGLGGYSGKVMEKKKTYFTEKLTWSIWNNSQVPHSQWTSQSVLSANWTLEQPSQKSCPKLQIQQMLEMDLLLITSNSETIPEPGMVSTVYFLPNIHL